MKTAKQKQLILEQLRKTLIIQVATEKVGIARRIYYTLELAGVVQYNLRGSLSRLVG